MQLLAILKRTINGSITSQFSDSALNYHYILSHLFSEQDWGLKKKHVHPLRFDFMCKINTLKGELVSLAIEYNGPYHYYQRRIKWRKTILLNNDWLKRIWCRASKVKLICISPASPLTDRYINFRINSCLNPIGDFACEGSIQSSQSASTLTTALSKVDLKTSTWNVHLTRDDDVCIVCLVEYSLHLESCYCEHPGMHMGIKLLPLDNPRKFYVVCWRTESTLSSNTNIIQINLPEYILTGKHLLQYLTCRIIDQVDDICLYALHNCDQYFHTKTISQCVAEKRKKK